MILQRLRLQEFPGSIPDLFDVRPAGSDRGQVVHTNVRELSDDVHLEKSSAGASLNNLSPPELHHLVLNFLATFLVVTLVNNDRLFSRHCPRSSSVWVL